jgi:hypothetical protein
VKTSHHAQFDEAWYLQPSCPPAAQLLYDLGILPEGNPPLEFAAKSKLVTSDFQTPGSIEKVLIPWPPMKSVDKGTDKWVATDQSILLHLPLRTLMHELPRPITAKAACTKPLLRCNITAELVKDFKIGKHDMAMVYMSPNPYHEAFEQTLDLSKFNFSHHPTAGLSLFERVGWVHLGTISLSTPSAKLHEWRSCVRGAWLIKIGNVTVRSLEDVNNAFCILDSNKSPSATTLLFSHPEICPNLSQDGIPIVFLAPFTQNTHDQLNNRWEFTTVADHLRTSKPKYNYVQSGDVLNVVTRVMQLTRGKLLKQPDWNE